MIFLSSVIAAQGLAVNQLSGGEKILLFCVFIIIVIIITNFSSIVISVSFVVILNCLYLNP